MLVRPLEEVVLVMSGLNNLSSVSQVFWVLKNTDLHLDHLEVTKGNSISLLSLPGCRCQLTFNFPLHIACILLFLHKLHFPTYSIFFIAE